MSPPERISARLTRTPVSTDVQAGKSIGFLKFSKHKPVYILPEKLLSQLPIAHESKSIGAARDMLIARHHAIKQNIEIVEKIRSDVSKIYSDISNLCDSLTKKVRIPFGAHAPTAQKSKNISFEQASASFLNQLGEDIYQIEASLRKSADLLNELRPSVGRLNTYFKHLGGDIYDPKESSVVQALNDFKILEEKVDLHKSHLKSAPLNFDMHASTISQLYKINKTPDFLKLSDSTLQSLIAVSTEAKNIIAGALKRLS